MFNRDNYDAMTVGMMVKDTVFDILWQVKEKVDGGVRLKCATSENGSTVYATRTNCRLTFVAA